MLKNTYAKHAFGGLIDKNYNLCMYSMYSYLTVCDKTLNRFLILNMGLRVRSDKVYHFKHKRNVLHFRQELHKFLIKT